MAHADDLVLTVPSASALRKMLPICDNYITKFYMSFNASKSKCVVMLSRSQQCLRPLLQYCDFKIVTILTNLCLHKHLITDGLDDSLDIAKRQGDFIGQINSVLCYFHQLTSAVKYRLFRSFLTSLYGCELWHSHMSS